MIVASGSRDAQHRLADDELAARAKAKPEVIRAKLTELVAAACLVPQRDAGSLAERIYVVWSRAILAWAIDIHGTVEDWLRMHIEHALPADAQTEYANYRQA